MRSRRALATLLIAVLALELFGCAPRAPLPVLAPEPKPDLGAVGLTIAQEGPDSTFQRPGVVGAGDGAKEGAKIGALASITPGVAVLAGSRGDPRVVMVGLALLAAGAMVAPASAGVGAAVGALAVPSREKVERNEAALERAVIDASLSHALTYRIMEIGRERPIFCGADPDVPAVDTWLALDAPEVSLRSNDPTEWRPDLRLRVSVRARLLRAADGAELRAWFWEHEGGKAPLFEWGANDASLFRAELERAGRALAVRIIGELY